MSASSVVPVAVSQTGFPWTAVMMALANLLIGGVLVALVKSRPALKKLTNEREANLLMERAGEMKTMRETIVTLSARLDAREIQHEAERAYDRHRINNFATSLKAFFILVKRHPEDAAGAAAEIEAMRAEQIESERKEAIALRTLIATLSPARPPPME